MPAVAPPGLRPASVAPTASVSLDAAPSATWPDLTWVAAVNVQPGALCNIYPQGGNSKDLGTSDTVQASSDGVVRFYAPPPSWGSQLAVDCSLNGVSQGQYRVNLLDSSTFTRQSVADLVPIVRTQPAFTGDPTSISTDGFRQLGYPGKPDGSARPDEYSRWLQFISQARPRYEPVSLGLLGAKGWQWDGNCNGGSWTGVIQAAVQFEPLGGGSFSCSNTNWPGANKSEFYESYYCDTNIPAVTCICNGLTYLWCGIGGFANTNAPGTNSALLQHGFALAGNGVNTQVELYWEFWPSGATIYPLFVGWNENDEIELEAWGSASSACNTGTRSSPSWGCFEWVDYTAGQYSWVAQQPPFVFDWWPTTFEMVAEVPGANPKNIVGWSESFQGGAWDWNGNIHYDPGNSLGGTDPYIGSFSAQGNDWYWLQYISGGYIEVSDPPTDPLYINSN
jgi:hypothetical protein